MKNNSGKRHKGPKRRTKRPNVDPRALHEIRSLISPSSCQRDMLIENLHIIQDQHGHLSSQHLVALASEMKLAIAEVYEVASFYHHFDIVKDGQEPPPDITVRVCESISCQLAGSEQLFRELDTSLGDAVRLQRVPCVGRCDEAPVAVVGQNPIRRANATEVSRAVDKKNTQIALPRGTISLETYKAGGGYETVGKCFHGEITLESVLGTMETSGLRGLGGAGFPAGQKWRIVAEYPRPRLLAVNIDEGEPGTFKDRHYLERDPHRFLEGLLISCWATEIDEVYIYVRDEYPGCLQILRESLRELSADPTVPLPAFHLRRGAGAYVCGEESAMIESIEGKRGMPRLRPPYVAEVGLFGRPTLEHNFETLYWVRDILEKGASWFSEQGRNGRKGVRSFSVSGRIKNPGVHLAPAGITLSELIEEYCGGMLLGHKLYGYFPGGASGGILPASLSNIPLDFDTLQPHGCFIGSAAIIVLSDQDSAKAAALNAMRFFSKESCGKCTPCRVGTKKASMLMAQEDWDIPLLEDLAQVMADASICGLGQAAPNPLRSIIKYFTEELI